MKSNSRFMALIESILDQKQKTLLKSLVESSGKRRVSEETEDVTGDEIHDGLSAGDDKPGISGVGSSGGGAGSTGAARKADGADTAQADISHLEEEDNAELEIGNLMTGSRDGDDVVKSESTDEDEEYLDEAEDCDDDEEVVAEEEEETLDSFFENFDEFEELASEAKKPAKKKVPAKKPPFKKK